MFHHRFAWQAEREIETAEPGAGPGKKRFEIGPGWQALKPFQMYASIVSQTSAGDGYRLA